MPLTFFDGLLPRSEGCQGTGCLELRLHPVLGVGVVAGQVDPQTAILRQQNKCSLLLQESGICKSHQRYQGTHTNIHMYVPWPCAYIQYEH